MRDQVAASAAAAAAAREQAAASHAQARAAGAGAAHSPASSSAAAAASGMEAASLRAELDAVRRGVAQAAAGVMSALGLGAVSAGAPGMAELVRWTLPPFVVVWFGLLPNSYHSEPELALKSHSKSHSPPPLCIVISRALIPLRSSLPRTLNPQSRRVVEAVEVERANAVAARAQLIQARNHTHASRFFAPTLSPALQRLYLEPQSPRLPALGLFGETTLAVRTPSGDNLTAAQETHEQTSFINLNPTHVSPTQPRRPKRRAPRPPPAPPAPRKRCSG